MLRSVLTILIFLALCVSSGAEYIETDCEHDCECESSNTCICEACSSLLTMLTAGVLSFDDYSVFITFSESFYPVFIDQECFGGIDHPPRLS